MLESAISVSPEIRTVHTALASFTAGRWACHICEPNGRRLHLEFHDPGDGSDATGSLRVENEEQVRSFCASIGTWFEPGRSQGGILLRGLLDDASPLALRIPATRCEDALFSSTSLAPGETFVGSDTTGRCYALTRLGRVRQ